MTVLYVLSKREVYTMVYAALLTGAIVGFLIAYLLLPSLAPC